MRWSVGKGAITRHTQVLFFNSTLVIFELGKVTIAQLSREKLVQYAKSKHSLLFYAPRVLFPVREVPMVS